MFRSTCRVSFIVLLAGSLSFAAVQERQQVRDRRPVHVNTYLKRDRHGYIIGIEYVLYNAYREKIGKGFADIVNHGSPKEPRADTFMGSATFKDHVSLVWHKHCLSIGSNNS